MQNPTAEIVKTADFIADGSWFSWVHCRKRLKALSKPVRKDAMKLLTVAQKQRRFGADELETQFSAFLKRQIDPMQSFVVPVQPGAYATRVQPVFLGGKKIGHTLGAERLKGGKLVIYYTSKDGRPMRCVKVEAAQVPTGSDYLNSIGMRHNQTRFHVEPMGAI